MVGRRLATVFMLGLWVAPAYALSGAPAPMVAGRPDMTGTWEMYPFPPDPDETGDMPPPGGEPELREPYASSYRATRQKQAQTTAAGKAFVDSRTQCRPDGMPTMMFALEPIEILQTRAQVTVIAEEMSQIRRIFLDEPLPDPDEISPGYSGYSVGRWEGDTLVVETIGIRADLRFLDLPRTPEMKLVERIRLTAPDRLEDQITIEDPKVFKKPYSFTLGFKRIDYHLMEYDCDNSQYEVGEDGSLSVKTDPKTP